jgi:outer membrane protein OmpA-like peptidoglycan-associated protein
MPVRRTAARLAPDAEPLFAAAAPLGLPPRPVNGPCAPGSSARRLGWPLALLLVAVGAASALPRAAVAAGDTVVHYREGQRVDPQEVAQLLGGARRTRSIRLLDDTPTTAPLPTAIMGSAAPEAVATPAPPVRTTAVAPTDGDAPVDGLSLPVRFGFGSSDILPDARPQLDALADGIRMLSPQRVVSVEGHTDATGPDAYNLKLSRERALAVRAYLIRRGIDGDRLKAVGYGESWPVGGADPYAGINRRVQFRGS